MFKAAVTTPYPTNLPRDRVVTTFWFAQQTADEFQESVIRALTCLDHFYNAPVDNAEPINNLRVADMLSPWPSWEDTFARVVNVNPVTGHEMGEPVEIPLPIATDPEGIVQALPNEVAVAISWTGYTGSEQGQEGAGNRARRRGRIFMGPLNDRAVTNVTEASNEIPPRPSSELLNTFVNCSERLLLELMDDSIDGADDRLCIYSRADQDFAVVNAGWVDDEFDTQRRRGNDATARLLITSPY